MRKKLKPVPEFATYEEAARFFDENDTTDLEFSSEGWEILVADRSSSRRRTARSRSVVHVPVDIESRNLRRITTLAKRAGKTPREWLRDVIEAAAK